MPMSHRPDVVDFTTLEGSTVIPPEAVRAAALAVCHHAPRHEVPTLLAALGLLDGDHLATVRKVREVRDPKRLRIGAR